VRVVAGAVLVDAVAGHVDGPRVDGRVRVVAVAAEEERRVAVVIAVDRLVHGRDHHRRVGRTVEDRELDAAGGVRQRQRGGGGEERAREDERRAGGAGDSSHRPEQSREPRPEPEAGHGRRRRDGVRQGQDRDEAGDAYEGEGDARPASGREAREALPARRAPQPLRDDGERPRDVADDHRHERRRGHHPRERERHGEDDGEPDAHVIGHPDA